MRKGMAQGLARPAQYDRNAVAKNGSYGFTIVAPHTTTQRWTYTVPAGKRTQVATLYVHVARVTAAAPGAQALNYIGYTPSGGGFGFIAAADILTNAVGDQQNLGVGSNLFMAAGDNIADSTVDASTGGTVEFGSAWSGTEFDV